MIPSHFVWWRRRAERPGEAERGMMQPRAVPPAVLCIEEAIVYPTIGGSGPTSLLVADLGIPTIMTGSVANTGAGSIPRTSGSAWTTTSRP